MTESRPTLRPAWLGALLVALLVAVLAPAIARADEGAAGGTAVAAEAAAARQEPAAQEPASADEGAAVAEEPAAAGPVDREPAAPPAEEGAVDEPVATEPTAPPATTRVDDRPPVELPGLAELLPVEAPSPVGEAAATPAPTLAELVPILGAPGAPRGAALAVPPPEPPKAPAAPAVAAQDGAPALTTTTLGGPPVVRGAGPVAEASREAVEGTAVPAAAAVPLQGAFVTLDPARVVVPAAPVAGGGPATPATGAFAAAEAEFPAPQVVSPIGPAPSQSLLAVLAAYILPGSGPVPASTIMVLVMLGLILAAVFAPRPVGSERIWLSGLVGARVGHGLAVRRPG